MCFPKNMKTIAEVIKIPITNIFSLLFTKIVALESIINGQKLDAISVPFNLRNSFLLPTLPCHKLFHRLKRNAPSPEQNNNNSKKHTHEHIGIKKLDLLLDPKENISREELIENEKLKYIQNFGAIDIKKAYENLFEILWYSQLPCYDIKDITSSVKDQMSVIKRCFWKGREVNCPAIFQKRPTDRGMCCSFNARKADELFQNTTYSNIVHSMNKKDAFYSIDDGTLPDWFDSKSQSGQQKGLQLILDAHADRISSGTISENYRGFISIVDGNENYPLTQRKGFLVRPGRANNVAMSAYQVISDPNVKSVSPEKRNCYFTDENPLKMHQNYTYTNCILECSIDVVRQDLKERNGKACTPWFYPSVDEYVTEMCDPWETRNFLRLVAEVPSEKCSHCLSDCEITNYEARISTASFRMCDHTNLGASSMCNMQDLTINPPMWSNLVSKEYLVAKGEVPEFAQPSPQRLDNIRKLVIKPEQQETLAFKNAYEESPTYDAFEKDIGIVNFYFEKSSILQYKRSSRLTVVDMISQIGGLLGVAMGISLISVVEIVYWITIRLFRNIEANDDDRKKK